MTDAGYDRFARYYDLDLGDESEDIDLYLGFAKRSGGPVLEVGCGTGRLLLPLARAGYRCVGVDVSPAMLAIARRKLAAIGSTCSATFVRADARDFELSERFGLAFIGLNSFMHFVTDGDQRQVLAGIRRRLDSLGTLILDLPNPDASLLGETSGQLVHEWTRTSLETGWLVTKLRSQRVDTSTQLLDLLFIYDEVDGDGLVRRTAVPFQLRYFYRRELELLLEACGFSVEAVYGDYWLGAYAPESPKLIVVARPRG
jgi:SAM-dependent methyltransferase